MLSILLRTAQPRLEKACVNPYDVIVLDVMFPDIDGLRGLLGDACQRSDGSRSNADCADAVPDRIAGLNAGADDYLTKPFDFQELLARLRALLRRRPRLGNPTLQIADLVVDTHLQKVSRADVPIVLTTREYALLEFLALQNGGVVGRADISEHVWDESYDPASNLIEVYVQRLRRKIDYGHTVRLLHTRRGEGYQLTPEGPADV